MYTHMINDIIYTCITIIFIFIAAFNIWTPYVEGNALGVGIWFTGIIVSICYITNIVNKYT